MKRNQVFVADDGTQFETAKECKEHEVQSSLKSLVGRTEEDILAAIGRLDIPLANALERAGKIIAGARRESGELRRTKKVAA